MSETKKEEKKKLADEDAARRIKQLEDQVETLRKQVANHKQEEDTLLSDMEVTGQAFEDMQEQNGRLVQQLREKDDANFKLMSERIKSNQIARLAREEKEMYLQQVATLTTQVMISLIHFKYDIAGLISKIISEVRVRCCKVGQTRAKSSGKIRAKND